MRLRSIIFHVFAPLVMLVLAGANCFAQDYTYDANGNLSKDSNKQISFIHYNCLNLADTIVFNDGRKIVYMYSGSGKKLQQKVINSNGGLAKKVDYISGAIYENDTLRQVREGNGRVVPILAGNAASPWEYQYEQSDLVGNVRVVLTSRQDVDNNKATFEMATVSTGQNQFQRYEDARRINSTLFDHTKSGSSSYLQRLNGSTNEKYGLAKSLSVMPGDVVNLEVFAKYVDQDASHWLPLLTTLMTQVTNGATGIVVDGSGYSGSGTTPIPFVGLNGTSNDADAGPKAYLNWLVFDKNFLFKNGGYVKMKASAKENGSNVSHDQLSKQLTITEPGFVYVYLSNEATSPVDVFFDDFTVELVKGSIVQQTDYDPFGLALTETTREHAEPNNFLYNRKELQQDFDLNWYDYGARMYDPALGRWHVVDPSAEALVANSPFSYVSNNPLLKHDPDGKLERDENGYIIYKYQNHSTTIPLGTNATYYDITIKADDGTDVWALKLHDGTENNKADCHGITFANGDFWINNDQVYKILDGDGWVPVDRNNAKAGDIAIINLPDPKGSGRGAIIHSVTVSKVKTSKWKQNQITVSGKGGNSPKITEDNIDDLVSNALTFKPENDPTPDEEYKKAVATFYRRKHPEKKPDRTRQPPPEPPHPKSYNEDLPKF